MPELIANRYTLLSELGRGGFATVYRALDTRLNREIALKILNPALTDDPRFIELFHREAQTAASLKHPHIVTIFDTGEFEMRLFITMELLAGLDLRRRVTRDGPLPLPLTVSIIEQIASALDYAHKRGIIHRDVKAANIIVDEAGHATLTDFGLVRALESSTYGSSVSMSGGFVGSVEYIPPEMVNGEKATARSDQYSLGVVTYEMVTGQLPFKAETPIAIAVAHANKTPRDPRELRSDMPQGMSAAILKVLAKQPEERYADTKAFAAALREELDRPAREAAEQDVRRTRSAQEEQEREAARHAAEIAALEAKRQREEQEAREARKKQEAEATALAAQRRREAEEKARREVEERQQHREVAEITDREEKEKAENVVRLNQRFTPTQPPLDHAVRTFPNNRRRTILIGLGLLLVLLLLLVIFTVWTFIDCAAFSNVFRFLFPPFSC